MLYIHQAVCISPQDTFHSFDATRVHPPVGNKLVVREPSYEGIPRNLLRRMGKAVRMGTGASVPVLRLAPRPVSGFIVGTGNGGTEDSYKFLEQINEYGEEMLTPGSFSQSTSNVIASQLSQMDRNRGYNMTHVHRGLAFEMALQDAMLLSAEDEAAYYLLTGVDELSASNFALDDMEGWYPPGTIAGEGAAAFLVSGHPQDAIVGVRAVATLHSSDVEVVSGRLKNFLSTHLPLGEDITVLITGENGDARLRHYYEACEEMINSKAPLLHFKRYCGEYPTATSFALWLTYHRLSQEKNDLIQNYLIYNTYKGRQHSFILLTGISR
ncbi:beta-ketoacyl synthase chain length factor [Flavitalea sp. BT771]|uniref:beta-ketoacyl synthase chain length factor n=1 Tax=Flavitalea sp. BT771 TaxID=3063329 RepID=UPI0026E28D3C|nr:beta-ketoacyl synthase chain length factor [Flavitalea sp. BT771]MDO6429981.1 beta-ketoacyl synthase chain length factor [Flavitalea sp. BT771]MDV6217891.1 beta-ketoacyl synthase chain length factor [Flavitalea sp. BT771]